MSLADIAPERRHQVSPIVGPTSPIGCALPPSAAIPGTGGRGHSPDVLGIPMAKATPDKVVVAPAVRGDLCTIPGVMHGGALMALADTVGRVMHLPQGAGTNTIESKTNFPGAAAPGMWLTGETKSLHPGCSTMVRQTRIQRKAGRLIAQVTGTQLVLPPQG